MLALLFGTAVAVAAPTTDAAARDPDVRAALASYEALDFGAVVPLLERALARGELGAEDRQLALAYLGRTHAVFRDAERAETRFTELLTLDPGYEVEPYESPLIREAFARAQARSAPEPANDDAGHQAPPDEPAATADDGGTDADASTPPAHVEPPDPRGDPPSDEVEDLPITPLLIGGAALLGAALVGVTLAVLAPWDGEPVSGSLGRWELP